MDFRTHQLPRGKEPPRSGAGHPVLPETEAECAPEWLNEQITHACEACLTGATAAPPYSTHQRVINTFILLSFSVSFWKSCHGQGGRKAEELNKKIP